MACYLDICFSLVIASFIIKMLPSPWLGSIVLSLATKEDRAIIFKPENSKIVKHFSKSHLGGTWQWDSFHFNGYQSTWNQIQVPSLPRSVMEAKGKIRRSQMGECFCEPVERPQGLWFGCLKRKSLFWLLCPLCMACTTHSSSFASFFQAPVNHFISSLHLEGIRIWPLGNVCWGLLDRPVDRYSNYYTWYHHSAGRR